MNSNIFRSLYVIIGLVICVALTYKFNLFSNPFFPFFVYSFPAFFLFPARWAVVPLILSTVVGMILFSMSSVYSLGDAISGSIEILLFGGVVIYMVHLVKLTKKQSEEILELERERLTFLAQKEFARNRNEFLVVAAHELKTPVTVITLYADMLENTYVDKSDIKVAAGTILKESDHITHVIEDILARFEPNL